MITIAAMLVIAKGVLYTGVVSRVTYRLLAGVTDARQTLRRLIPPVGIVSALINTTPIVAMLIPAARELEQRSGIPTRGVLLPVAHATTLAGSATLIGTEIPISSRANAIGRTAAELGVLSSPDFELVEIQRWGQRVDAQAVIEDGDVLIYRTSEAGVGMLWASPRFGQSRQDLYKVSISTDDQATVRELEENDDVVVIACSDHPPVA